MIGRPDRLHQPAVAPVRSRTGPGRGRGWDRVVPTQPEATRVDIRRATLDDLNTLVQLRLDFLTDLGSLRTAADRARLSEANREYLAKTLPTGECVAWLAEVGSRTVATGWLTFFERPPLGRNPRGLEAYIMNMYTIPEWRGQGISTALLQEIIAYAKSAGAPRVWLHATPAGRPIYEKAGFVPNTREMELWI